MPRAATATTTTAACVSLPLLLLLLATRSTAAFSLFSSFKAAAAPQPQQQHAPEQQHGEITSLPGYSGPLPSRHYGGYVSVGSRQLYYYLAESTRSPADDPVVLWLNGGPGCSSFDGWVYEHGPFKLQLSRDRNQVMLRDNPFAWNTVANMIFLDSPSPVGLSYSTHHADYATNDTATAADSHAFLRALFARYPHLQHNDFYISGESYAGIYVPMLAREVVKGNKRGLKPDINLKGYLVGNGCTDEGFDGNARVPFAAGKSLISQALYRRVQAACGDNFYDVEAGSRCQSLLAEVDRDTSRLNLYNILDICHHADSAESTAPASLSNTQQQQQERLAALRASGHNTWPLTGAVKQGQRVHNWATLQLGHNPPCTVSREADLFLNDPAVRAALHAAPQSLTGPWQLCSDRIMYTADGGSMLPVHNFLVRKAGLRALIYSGDEDLCVPHTGSEAWTQWMHRSHSTECQLAEAGGGAVGDADDDALSKCDGVAKRWSPWFNSAEPKQVAGYTVEYTSGLTYATVKGAGHMVPETNPRAALDLFTRFIAGQSLTSPSSREGAQDPDLGAPDTTPERPASGSIAAA